MKETKTENFVTDIFAVVHENNRHGSHCEQTNDHEKTSNLGHVLLIM